MLTTLLLKLLSKSKDKKDKKQKSKFDFDFEKVNLHRVKNTIMYSGIMGSSSRISGYINNDGAGEEIIIIRNNASFNGKGHKIRHFKTKLQHWDFRNDYFNKSLLENLVRIRTL